jgi:hypothetical protein
VPDRVVDQVGDEALHEAGVAGRRGGGEGGPHPDATPVGLAATGGHRLPGHRRQVEPLPPLDTLLPTGEGEQRADQLIVMVVVGTMVATGEYRRGLIRTTLAATPSRGLVLAAKAVVVAAVTFVTGVLAAAVVVTLGQRVLRGSGVYVHAASAATELRVIAGTGALLAVAAVLALALGTLLRRGTTAVTAAVATIVLPYLLVFAALPVDAGRWVLRVTPAAAFALQQSAKQYDQVANLYIPAEGYFPLPPWAGFGVLAGYAAVALAGAAWLLRRRDA